MMSCGVVLVPLEDKFFKNDVGPKAPENFPVLVVSTDGKSQQAHARIVFKKNLDAFLAKNPGSTYLVPAGQEQRLNQEVSHAPDLETGSPAFHASFSVAQLSKDRQSLQVEYDLYDDLTSVGWYEATEKEIFPKSRKAHGDIGLLIVPAFLITLVIWTVLFIAYVVIRRLKKKAPRISGSPPAA